MTHSSFSSEIEHKISTPATVVVGHHYPELDGLRGIAVLLVICFHSRFVHSPATLLQRFHYSLINIGWIGVELFFVLSGFLITGILLDTREHPHYFSNFYRRRALRIFPLYYLAVFLVTGAALFFPDMAAIRQPSLIGNASYWLHFQNLLPAWGLDSTPILAHFWSLAVEEQFYLFWPLVIMWTGHSARLGKICLLLWGISIAFRIVATNTDMNGVAFFSLARLDGLVLGAYTALMFKQYGSLVPLVTLARRLSLYSGFVILAIYIESGQFFSNSDLVLRIGLPALALFFASGIVLTLTSRRAGLLRRCLSHSWLRFVGKISFGMYVVHMMVIELLAHYRLFPAQNFWLAQSTFTFLAVGISTALAWLIYTFFETVFLRLKPKYD